MSQPPDPYGDPEQPQQLGPYGSYGGPGGYGPPGPYGPPGQHGPYGPPGPGGGRPPGLSNKAKFWIGFALGIPALVVAGVLTSIPSTLLVASGAGSGANGVLQVVVGVVELVGLALLVGFPRTRWWGLGLLAGIATALIVFAGVCAVLFAVLLSSS